MRILKLIGPLTWITCLLSISAASQTIIPRMLLGQYQQVVWQDRQGLPQNGIVGIAQTPDGYLWLGTSEGVVRFDGVRFTTFDPFNTDGIKSGNIMSLLATRDGALWIGTHGGGVTRYQNGRFTAFSSNEGLSDTHARSLFEDSAGNVWVGTDGGGLNLFRDGRFLVFSTANGLPDDHIWAFAEDAAGNLWVGTNGGLARLSFTGVIAPSASSFPTPQVTTYTTRDGLSDDRIRALRVVDGYKIWIGLQNGLCQLENGRFLNIDAPASLAHSHVHVIGQTRDGSLWFGTYEGGLYRLKDGHYDTITVKEGLAGANIRAFYQDPLGDLWIGTSGTGLIQLRVGRVRVYSEADGLPNPMALAIYEDRTGGIWIGTGEGLCRFKDGKFTTYHTSDGQTLRSVTGITSDHEGNLLVRSNRPDVTTQILKFREDSTILERAREEPVKNASSAMVQTRTSDLWFGTLYDGLHRIRDNHDTVYHVKDGLADDYVQVLFEDRSGSLWIGTRNGISRFKDEKLSSWTSKEGFPGRLVWSFYEDVEGALWIGTDGDGLVRFKNGKFAVVTTRNGLYDNLAFRILEDDNGNLWMSGNKGIYRASLKELNDFCDGRVAAVNSFSYGAADGMLSRECNGANPAGIKARDGRLWFPTVKGVVVIEPRGSDPRPPLITIEQVLLDSTALSPAQKIQIKPGEDNLEIQYTALSWSRAPQVKFKYQMLGLSDAWIEAGTRRIAYFAHLPPGRYTFRVIADNGEGIWNMDGKTLTIVVLPPFYRTWWFMTLVGLCVFGLGFVIYKVRVGQLEKERTAQEEFARQLLASQEQERQRIAAELHDSLGQTLLIIKNRVALAQLDGEEKAVVDEQLSELSQSAAAAIDECREIAYNLRPYQISRFGLSKTLAGMFMRINEVTEIKAETEIEEIDNALSEEAQINVYRIVQECVNNVIKHSQAAEAKLIVRREASGIVLVIQDNGRGFIPVDHHHDANKRSGFGLIGVAERVKLLGGTIQIESTQGTTIKINLATGV